MFEKIESFDVLYGCCVSVYRSSITGLHVVHADLKDLSTGLVHGQFIVPTETFSNGGYPHTLEHLVFNGSQKHPYKGTLSKLANRCLAQGTNAWTDQDHTAYTLSTAGEEGFLQILPVYLEHILFPELSNEAFATEVHHITGTGEDAGVVYCEMQARENTPDDLVHQAILQDLLSCDSKVRNGYAYNTGGLLQDIRALQNRDIIEYHHQYYNPKNITLYIGGSISAPHLLSALSPIEDQIAQAQKNRYFSDNTTRPFLAPVPRLKKTSTRSVLFPDEDEKTGQVAIGWQGPTAPPALTDSVTNTQMGAQFYTHASTASTASTLDQDISIYGNTAKSTKKLKREADSNKHLETTMALEVLCDYLTDGPVSPLTAALVDCKAPYCSMVSTSMLFYRTVGVLFWFTGASVKRIDAIPDKVISVLAAVGKSKLDMDRLRDIVNVYIQREKNAFEKNAYEAISAYIVPHVIYGNSLTDLELAFKKEQHVHQLLSYSETEWKSLLKTYFTKAPHVSVVGKPSVSCATELKLKEEQRMEQQLEALDGPALLLKKALLERALAKNNIEPPTDLINAFTVPDVSKIKTLSTATTHVTPTSEFPFTLQIDDYPSEFVVVKTYIDTQHLSAHLRPYLEILLDAMFELDLRVCKKISSEPREEEVLSYKKVVAILDREFVSYSNGIGATGGDSFSAGSVSSLIKVQFKAQKSKLALAIEWTKRILCDTILTPKRILVSLNRLHSDIQDMKRDGSTIVAMLSLSQLVPHANSNIHATNIYRQEKLIAHYLPANTPDDSDDSDMTGSDMTGSDLTDSEITDSDITDTGSSDEDGEELQMERVGELIGRIEELRKALFVPENLIFHVSAGVSASKDTSPSQLIKLSFADSIRPATTTPRTDINKLQIQRLSTLISQNTTAFDRNIIHAMKSLESAYLLQSVRGPCSFLDTDIAALLVLIEYFTADEGVFWNEIRGKGLAYTVGMVPSVESGIINLKIYKSNDLPAAYTAVHTILASYLSKHRPFDPKLFEAAKSSCIFEEFDGYSSFQNAAFENFMEINLTNRGAGYLPKILASIQKVTLTDLDRVLLKYLSPFIYAPATSTISIVTPASKLESTINHFSSLNCTLTQVDDIPTFLEL